MASNAWEEKGIQKTRQPHFHQHSSHSSSSAHRFSNGLGRGQMSWVRLWQQSRLRRDLHMSPNSHCLGDTWLSTEGTHCLVAPGFPCKPYLPKPTPTKGSHPAQPRECPSSKHPVSMYMGEALCLQASSSEVRALENSFFLSPCFTHQFFPPTEPCCHFTFVLVHE